MQTETKVLNYRDKNQKKKNTSSVNYFQREKNPEKIVFFSFRFFICFFEKIFCFIFDEIDIGNTALN